MACMTAAMENAQIPFCRVMPKGGPPVEAPTASGAWNALYTAAVPGTTAVAGQAASVGGKAAPPLLQGAAPARAGSGMSGARAFGLSNPRWMPWSLHLLPDVRDHCSALCTKSDTSASRPSCLRNMPVHRELYNSVRCPHLLSLEHVVCRVTAALTALPGADRCERFCGWLDGEERAPPPPLVGHSGSTQAPPSDASDSVIISLPELHATTRASVRDAGCC